MNESNEIKNDETLCVCHHHYVFDYKAHVWAFDYGIHENGMRMMHFIYPVFVVVVVAALFPLFFLFLCIYFRRYVFNMIFFQGNSLDVPSKSIPFTMFCACVCVCACAPTLNMYSLLQLDIYDPPNVHCMPSNTYKPLIINTFIPSMEETNNKIKEKEEEKQKKSISNEER